MSEWSTTEIGKILAERYAESECVKEYLSRYVSGELQEYHYNEIFETVFEELAVPVYKCIATFHGGCPGNGGYSILIEKVDEFYACTHDDIWYEYLYDSLEAMLKGEDGIAFNIGADTCFEIVTTIPFEKIPWNVYGENSEVVVNGKTYIPLLGRLRKV